MSKKHTAISVLAKGAFDAAEVDTPAPGPGEILLKVAYASMPTFDAYMTDLGFAVEEFPITLGLNASGRVADVGPGASLLRVGDRVTVFSPHLFEQGSGSKDALPGTMQEYLVLPDHLFAKIPDDLDLSAAATIPDNFVTAFYTLFDQLNLPIPSSLPASSPPANAAAPILIYGAGSTTGQYALQLLHAAGYTNVTATASPHHHTRLRSIGAQHTLDYASPSLAADAAVAAGGDDGKFVYALDCISADATIAKIGPLVRPRGGKVAVLLPIQVGDTVAASGEAGIKPAIPDEENPFGEGVEIVYVKTFTYRKNNEFLKRELMPKILPSLLASGIITPNPVRLLDQGTFKERVETGLDMLRNNKVSGEKIIVKVGEE
ncbi:chaperonin 10-like protein [Mycena amicta]|nr:chaperonin 10-like protein [Mycena amicta]